MRSYKEIDRLRREKASSPAVQKMIARLGWTKPIVIPKGQRRSLGVPRLELRFRAAGVTLLFLSRKMVARGEPFLYSVTFKPPFAGALPKRLMWTDDRAKAQAKGGALRDAYLGIFWSERSREYGKLRRSTTVLAFGRNGRLSSVRRF